LEVSLFFILIPKISLTAPVIHQKMAIKEKFTTLSDSIEHQRFLIESVVGFFGPIIILINLFPLQTVRYCVGGWTQEAKHQKLSQFLMSPDTFMGGGSQITFFFVATKDENNDVARIELKACA
jgi:hypothetical protein